METLQEEDRYWLERRIPIDLWKQMLKHKHKLFVAGGFVRACIANEPVNDIDIFAPTVELARIVALDLVANGTGLRMIETDNAFTVLGMTHPLQFIHRWTFETPKDCIQSFDFTVARAAVWIGDEQDSSDHAILSTVCDPGFYPDLAAKRLVYCQPVRNEDAGGSMVRVLKFYQKGYRIPLTSLANVMARMLKEIDLSTVPASPEPFLATALFALLKEVDPDVDKDTLMHKPAVCSPR